MAPARPLDTNHRYDADVVDEMLRKIQEDPPELPSEPERMGDDIIEASVTDAGEEGEECQEIRRKADRFLKM